MKLFFLLTWIILCLQLQAQRELKDIIDQGIQLHDAGQYNKAIKIYREALAIDPESPLAHYEISLSYMYSKKYEKAIFHCNQVLDIDQEHQLHAYITKGSSLDYLGKPKTAIKVLKKGIREFGNNYLLHYNLALVYYKLQQFKKTEKHLSLGIENKADHSSSHLLMAYTMDKQAKKIQSMLSLYYFLFLEPNSHRSAQANEMLLEKMNGSAKQDRETNVINISVQSPDKDDEFSSVNMIISLLSANRYLEENEGKEDLELFIENTSTLIRLLVDQKQKSKSIWWNFYVPELERIVNSKHLNTYCYLINQSTSEQARLWIQKHEIQIYDFEIWLRGD